MLEARVAKLEDAQEATNETVTADVQYLQDQLKDAQDNIRALAKDNEMMREQLDQVNQVRSVSRFSD
jgi:TolA-binding protein